MRTKRWRAMLWYGVIFMTGLAFQLRRVMGTTYYTNLVVVVTRSDAIVMEHTLQQRWGLRGRERGNERNNKK